MYTLEYLPLAMRDMVEIVSYIGVKLANPDAAEALAEEMVTAADALTDMPYRCAVYMPLRPLKHEYRKLIVKKYILFYWVDEEKKRITVARVIYGGRDYEKLLDER